MAKPTANACESGSCAIRQVGGRCLSRWTSSSGAGAVGTVGGSRVALTLGMAALVARPLKGLAVVVVSDHGDLLDLLFTLLQMGGARVHSYASAQRALAAIADAAVTPDVVLLDSATTSALLEESVARLAETLASRYGISVPALIQAILLDYADRGMPREVPPEPAPGHQDRLAKVRGSSTSVGPGDVGGGDTLNASPRHSNGVTPPRRYGRGGIP